MILTICFICITFAIALILSAASDQQWESMVNNDLELDKLHKPKTYCCMFCQNDIPFGIKCDCNDLII